MLVTVHVTAHSRKLPHVQPQPDDSLRVYVTEIPEDGKANKAVIKALATYYDCAKSRIILVGGHTAHIKRFEISTT